MRTYIVLLNDRRTLERVENQTYPSLEELIEDLRKEGMDEEMEGGLGYYELTDFMDLVNDQILDNLTGTFIGYVNIIR
jgi:hypothetical protein